MDTIVALATPPGRSAIGVIRLSGPTSLEIARSLIGEHEFSPEPARALLKTVGHRESNKVLDRSLLTFFQKPNSYTGEDLVEISCHGSPVVLRQVIDRILMLGARLAGPGEFTLRAMNNGKLNLSQAEGIRDLINAQTDAAARQAARQLNGELSARLGTVKGKLVRIIVQLESAIEFVEDDLPELQWQQIRKALADLISDLQRLASTFNVGHFLRDGLKVTIIGRPNVGKSSLFNRLLSFDRAIVTELPGTTRDSLTESISLQGIPILLTDTAGLRESSDMIESIGVERTRQAMADADLLLVVVDGSVDLAAEDHEVLSHAEGARHIVARNKSDLASFPNCVSGKHSAINVSAFTGSGLDDLRAAILQPFGSVDTAESTVLITDSRHFDLLRRAIQGLESSTVLWDENASEELTLVGLNNALQFLGEITGETTTEEILSQIFATFCIGK